VGEWVSGGWGDREVEWEGGGAKGRTNVRAT
jgi:hypothetical protein